MERDCVGVSIVAGTDITDFATHSITLQHRLLETLPLGFQVQAFSVIMAAFNAYTDPAWFTHVLGSMLENLFLDASTTI